MAKSLALVCIFALFASSLAQTITTLTSGVAATGTLLPVATDYENDRQANYYKIFIPGNAKTVQLTVTKTDSICSYVNWYASGDKAPCNGEFSDPTDFSYVCKSADYSYSGSSASTRTYILGDTYSDETGIKSDAWFYVTVGRDALKTESCAYTVMVTITTCAVGEVAPYEYSKSGSVSPYAECEPLGASIMTATYSATLNITTQFSHHRIWVNRATAYIHFRITNATDYLYLYGNNGFAASESYYNCYSSLTYPNDELYCHFPEEGWFYFAFRQYSYSAGDSVGVILDIDTKVCSDDKAGFNCTYPAQNIATLTANQAFSIAAYPGSIGWEAYPVQYFYLDITNGTMSFNNFTATLTTGAATIIYRRNAFPADNSNYYRSSYDYESFSTGSESFALTWGDTVVGGRYYFAVSNSNSAAASFTASSASASATSAAATTDATTTTGGSGAASIVAPLALIALIIAALL
jgi:hypothetical protein